MTFQVKTFNNINPVGLAELGANFEIDGSDQADAYILRSENLHDKDFPTSLKAIARAGAGTNNIPLDQASEEGIVVFNTPGANANAVKEAVLAGILLSARDYIGANAWAQQLTGDDVPQQVEAGKKQFAGSEIAGKTLGVIGLGGIGARLANDARRLGMKVLGYDPYVSIETAWSISSHVQRVADIKEIFRQADYISLHVPLLDSTRGIINQESFELMQDKVVLLNFARGELVDQAALFAALSQGKIKNYVTDFATESLIEQEGVTVFPHVGGSTEEAELNCAVMAAQTLKRFLETGEIVNSVNFPEVRQTQTAPVRITLINRNVPNIVARITTAVSELGINIDNIINRSKGDYAYTLLDLDESDQTKIADLVTLFEASDNIIRVRLIEKTLLT